MLTLYTAIGHLKVQRCENGTMAPVVINGHQEYSLCKQEMILWSCLAFQILQIRELEKAYQTRMNTTQEKHPLPFPHYLNRLLLRGLIVKGEGLTGVDALYGLLEKLQIRPVDDRFSIRLFTCIHLYRSGKICRKEFFQYLKKGTHTAIEETILELIRTTSLTTAELVTCVDRNVQVTGPEAVMEALYQDDETTYETLAETVQLHHTQYPILQAIGNLYLHKQITFQQT